ncbi:MAG: creatininase family protein [Pseudomonadota bacterium]
MYLHHLTWAEIDAHLERDKGLILPIGSTEQHGPNGLLGTDCICPETIARHAAKEGGFLVGPTFNVGSAQHHMAFAGTMTLRPSTMIAAMTDWVNSLAAHGFERFFWLNGHGGNVPVIEAAFAQIYSQTTISPRPPGAGPIVLGFRNWWELDGVMGLCQKLYPEGHGLHATPSEVAITYYAYPEHQKSAEMSPKIAPFGPIRDAADYRKRFPDGRIGSNPALANTEDGEKLVTTASAALVKLYREFLSS